MKGLSSQTLVTVVLGVVEIVSFSIMSRFYGILVKEKYLMVETQHNKDNLL